MMNFEFLKGKKGFRMLAHFTSDAETFAVSHPDMSAISARKSLEWIVKTFYVKKYGKCREATLFDLIQDNRFSGYIDATTISCIHLVRQIGNNAAHGERIKKTEAIKALEALYYTIREIMRFFGESETYPDFNKEAYVPIGEKPVIKLADIQFKGIKEEEIKEEDIKASASEIPLLSTEVTKTHTPPIDFTEAETRRIFIDQALKEAGWQMFHTDGAIKPGMACVEIKLEGMPNESGIGYADYVLFDDDNRPLAVVEAKRACKDEEEGRIQAIRYADCMERIWGIRPVIFYTNGYAIQMIDGTGAPSRRVFGYYTKQELHSLIVRRDLRKIEDTRIDPNISDRYFIQSATTAVCEAFNAFHRKALVVMATGTGKTRCAISIVDVLQRAHWVKNILFLADRKELVRQAKNAFKKYLPDYTISAFSEEEKEKRDYNAHIVLSTHKTLLNLIDVEDKKFGIGRFDLVIIDECHRSVYNRYKAIFNYFDSMLLGLTATPREQVDDDTYKLFDMEKGKPTYAYDYQTAVAEDYLVNYFLLDRTTNLLKNGLKHDDLSPEEQEEYENLFVDDDGNFPQQINKEDFMRNVMNVNTIDLVLNTLMDEGLYIKSGERLGKTIIFAAKHEHAQMIVDRFKYLYPELAGKGFCELVDYRVNYVETVIDDFKHPEKMPVIAVSVDMLDTGVDIPEITNLVFFKRVFSVIKFWQMIGRGTRTCKNLNVFSPTKAFFKLEDEDATVSRHEHKQGFYLFDFCDNFDFFSMNPDGRKLGTSLSLTQRIFNLKLEMVYELQKLEHQENEEHKKYYEKWREECFSIVKGLNRNHINVRYNLKYVEKYSQAEAWNYLSVIDLKELQKVITPLVSSEDSVEDAKSFDVWLFNMELTEIIGEDDYSKAIQKVTDACEKLLDKTTIPEVKAKVGFLKEILTNEFWSIISVSKLEKIRTELRDIIHHIKEEAKPMVETNFVDVVIPKEGKNLIPQFKNYKRRVLDYLTDNMDHPVVQKIRYIESLTIEDMKELEHIFWEELGTQADYAETFKGEPIAAFVRRIVGLDNSAVQKMLGRFLQIYEFNSMQEEFIHQIVNYVRQNGDIVPGNLINNDPFRSVEYTELFEEKTKAVYDIVKTFHNAIYIGA